MQRLLRGRLFYVVLVLLTVFLYHSAFRRAGSPTPPDKMTVEQDVDVPPPELRLQPLDVVTVRLAIRRDPLRRVIVGLAIVAASAILTFGAGMSLWGLATGRWRRAWEVPSRTPRDWSFAEFGRIVMLTLFMVSLFPFLQLSAATFGSHLFLDYRVWVPTSALFLDGFILLAVLTFAVPKAASPWQSVGLSWRQMNATSIWIALRSYLTLVPWLVLTVLLIGEICRRLGITPPVNPIHRLMLEQFLLQEQRLWVIGLTLTLTCVMAPLVEEVLFRGVLFVALRKRLPRLASMVISGALFAALHPWIGFLPITLLGCLFAYLYERTGSLFSPLVVHMVHNTILVSGLILLRFLMQSP